MTSSPASSERLLTAEEFWQLSEPPEGGRMELVGGRVVTEMPVGELHAALAVELAAMLLAFAKQHRLGRVYVELGHRLLRNPDTVRAPDVSFLAMKEPRALSVRYIDLAPTLAIEIMSPDDREGDVATKVEQYFDAGSARVWIVRPSNRTITVHRQGGDSHTYTLRDSLTSAEAAFEAPGFELSLAELFAD